MDFNTLSIDTRLLIIVEDRCRKGKNSLSETKVKSTLFVQGVFESLSMVDLTEGEIDLEKEGEMNLAGSRQTLPIWTLRLIE
jgi:hypothetical protein